jgi:hypothetical protein
VNPLRSPFSKLIVCPFIVNLSVSASDWQNLASISFCRKLSLAFLRRRDFLEDDSSSKSTFFGFRIFFFLLIFFPFTGISQVLINSFFLGVIHIQIRYSLFSMQSATKRNQLWENSWKLLLAVLAFSFLFFTEVFCPFELARVSSKFQRTLFAFA